MTEEELRKNWPNICNKFPLICGINSYNNDLTIYACLQQAVKNFHKVIVFDDGSTDKTFEYIDKFIEDYNPNNLIVMSVDHIDPWPEQEIKKNHAKSKRKSHDIIKTNFPNAFYVTLEADVICFNNITERIYKRIAKWDDPLRDVEFFNVIMTIDKDNFRGVSDSEDEWITPKGIKQRGPCDQPGDWTLACFWNVGPTEIIPDPYFPTIACTGPWSYKVQNLKKGQDTDNPFGFHMVSYRNSLLDIDYSKKLVYTRKQLNDNSIDYQTLEKAWFPKELKLDKNKKRYLEKDLCDL